MCEMSSNLRTWLYLGIFYLERLPHEDNSMSVFIGSVLEKAIYFFTLPLRVLYFHGPRLGGFGFQEGVELEKACEQVTSVRSEFWAGSVSAIDECSAILERKFNAFVVGWCAVLIVCGAFQYVHFLTTKQVISPTSKKLDTIYNYLQDKKLVDN